MLKARLFLTSLCTIVLTATAFAQPAKPAGAGAPAAVKPAEPSAPMTDHAGTHVMKVPSELQWSDAPPALPKGSKVSVLEGDPSKPGPFTMRAQLPAKYKIAPHWHPAIEHVTIISGEGYMGSGEKFDEAVAKKLPAGSFAVMPIKHAHFFFTKKAAVIQIHGVGPWGITYVNPADDPRTAAAAAVPTPAKK